MKLYAVPLSAVMNEINEELARTFSVTPWPKCPHEGRPGEWGWRTNPLTGRGFWRSAYTGRVRK